MLQDDGVIQFRSADKKYLCAMRPGVLAHANATAKDEPGVVFRVHSRWVHKMFLVALLCVTS